MNKPAVLPPMTAEDLTRSFDVFDTTITRLVLRPGHVHWSVGARLRAAGLFDGAPDNWARRRSAAERRLSRAGRDPRLGDICRELANSLGRDADWATRVERIEIETEIALAAPVAGVVEEARRAGKPLFLSDTYHSNATLVRLLATCGVRADPARVHGSADAGATKRSGSLFRRIADKEGGPAQHTGDNPTTDFRSALRAGWPAQLVTGTGELTREESLYESVRRTCGPLVATHIAGAARAARLSEAGRALPEEARAIAAAVAAPLLTAFVAWCLRTAGARSAQRLFFVARDGQILCRLAGLLGPALGADRIAPHYLMASRRALLPAAFRGWTESEERRVFANMRGLTVGRFLARFAMDPAAAFPEWRGRFDAVVDEALEGELRVWLRSSAGLNRLDAIRREAEPRCLAYLRRAGLGAPGGALIVDIGWRGSLHRALATLADAGANFPVPEALYFGLSADAEPAPAPRFVFWPLDRRPNAALLEAFTLADHPSVIGYAPDAVPVLDSTLGYRLFGWDVHAFQDLVAHAAALMVRSLETAGRTDALAESGVRDGAVAAFRLFERFPTAAEARAFSGLFFADDQAHTNLRPIAEPLSNAARGLAALPRHLRDSYSLWLEGALAVTADPAGRWPQATKAMLAAVDVARRLRDAVNRKGRR